MAETPSDVAFSAAVKSVQRERGSRAQFESQAEAGGWPTTITADLAQFIADVTTCYLATASADGQPYVQHRGGPRGYLQVLDPSTIAFADFKGNRQYISTGNLAENPRVHLFLMDYENRRRVKVWGTAKIITGDDALAARLFPQGYRARVEQVVAITVAAWDMNCAQHIPQMFHAADVAETIRTLQGRIDTLQADLARLTDAMSPG
jgi:uncharacterized protein